ncbi:MAG: transglutaminaseTgpA domain-containing protein [Gemmataceae bacterium]
MSRPRTAALFSHLALAMAGVALGVAELDFLPEAPLVLAIYLALVAASWSAEGQWGLPTWAVNLIGLGIAGTASAWIASRLGRGEAALWQREVPLAVAVVPYLGPLLMGLTAVRLFCPRSPRDFWVLQGLGLLQVALGCVLSSGALFGGALLAYLVVGLCALAAHERHRQGGFAASGGGAAPGRLAGWLGFSLRWTTAVGLVALPLFLLTPRAEGPEWDPWGRFGFTQPAAAQARTGFAEEIDLNRGSTLQPDESVAFTVAVTDTEGQPARGLPGDQRWRGVVLDNYRNGRWRNSLNWALPRAAARPPGRGTEGLYLHFRVPGRAGGLFLAEPVRLGPLFNSLPVWVPNQVPGEPLFHEFFGTVVPVVPPSAVSHTEYRYTQVLTPGPLDRYPVLRTRGDYLQQLTENRPEDLVGWSRQLLAELAARGDRFAALRQAMRANAETGDPLPPEHWETAARLLSDHLARSSRYGYSLTFSRSSPDLDPVVDFLVNVRHGPCERFATGLALMLRAVGIPSRVIKGFRGAEEAAPGSYQVRNTQAHAWVEAIVLSQGTGQLSFDWATLDPTPEHDAEREASALSRLWQLQHSGQALWQDLIVGYGPTRQADLLHDRAEPGR